MNYFSTQLILCVNFLYSTVFQFCSDQLCFASLWTFGSKSSLLFSVNFSIIVEMWAVFHVITISIVRYLSLGRTIKSRSNQPWLDYRKCWRVLIIIYASVLLAYGPLYFHSEIKETADDEYCVQENPQSEGKFNYRLRFPDNEFLQLINFWWFGSICKIIPCSILCFMSVLLLSRLSRIRAISARFSSIKRNRQHCRATKNILVNFTF